VSAVSGDLVVTRPRHLDDLDSIVVVGVDQMDEKRPQSSTAREAPRADRAALAPWSVDLAPSGAIVVAGVELHPAIARDLYQRLGALLAEGERDELHVEWSRLAAWLDHHFAPGVPITGRTIGRPAQDVGGLAVRERADQVAVRLATYVVAFLRPRGGRWEGPALQLRPTATGHERRPTGVRIRVEHVPERTERPARVLPGPASGVRPAGPPAQPALPAWLQARRAQAREEQARVVEAVRGGAATFDAIAGVLRLPRELLRGHLELLVERRELRMRAANGERRWSLAPPRRARPGFEGQVSTKLRAGRAAAEGATRARSGPSTGPVPCAKGRRAKAPPPAPAPPRAPLRSCWTCNTSTHAAGACCPLCGTPF